MMRPLAVLFTLLVCLATASTAWSQDAAPAGQDPQARFDALLEEFRGIVAQQKELFDAYRAAADDEEEMNRIAEQHSALRSRGDEVRKQLEEAAVVAFQANPDADSEVGQLLRGMTQSHFTIGNYEKGYGFGKVLVDNGVDMPALDYIVGTSAYNIGKLDEAETLLKEAVEADITSQLGEESQMKLQMSLQTLPEYRQKWEAEQKLRAEESEADDLPRVKLETTAGDFVLELFENQAPNTVANFISLVEKGYYDRLIFHRVIPGFMAQGGCPEGTGTGGPGYYIPCECQREDHRNHFRGSLSMAHAGRDTGGSQFFLNFAPTPHLDGKHTVFGRVIDGLENLAQIRPRDPQADNPAVPTQIVKAEVLRKRPHEYEPKTIPTP